MWRKRREGRGNSSLGLNFKIDRAIILPQTRLNFGYLTFSVE
jgi:hypothetical protein